MSCHHGPGRNRLTEEQLDRWTVNALRHRDEVISGRPILLRTNPCDLPTGSLFCNPTIPGDGPFSKIADAVNAARANDIVVLLPGSYNQTMMIDKAVTLYATGRGMAIVGR